MNWPFTEGIKLATQTRSQQLTRLLMRLGAVFSALMGLFFLAAGVGGHNKIDALAAYDLGIIGLLYLVLTLGFWALAADPRRNIAIWRMLLILQAADALYETYHLWLNVWPRWYIGAWLAGDIWTLFVIGWFGWAWYRNT
jgi:hypothetical protein